ncbi:flavin monoamine oxidase family protein [Aliidiomarina sp. Khilg15.8]
MSAHSARIAIIGGGLSGLYAAYLLEQKGIRDYVLLEARDVRGGRIESVAAGFDLGPSWFWPDMQPQLDALIRELDLTRFEQFETGDMVVERTPTEPPMRMQGYVNSPSSTRLEGGMGRLIEALYQRLDKRCIVMGHTVHSAHVTDAGVELTSTDAQGEHAHWQAQQVLLALPPRLAVNRIEFSPALPEVLARQWQATPTWMAPHAKYIAVYETPFWRGQGLSGEARSARGPLNEIHDASVPDGYGALFGFFGIPAHLRKTLPQTELMTHCRGQLARLFGPEAATPVKEFIKDWALESYTTTTADLQSAGHHVPAPEAKVLSGPWQGCLTGIGSEWSRQFPGYLAGAIEATRETVEEIQPG